MDNGGRCDSRAYPHPSCAACGAIVFRLSHHAHVFEPRRKRHEVICGDCYACICLCANPVAQALRSLGVEANSKAVIEALGEERVTVLAQGSLSFSLN